MRYSLSRTKIPSQSFLAAPFAAHAEPQKALPAVSQPYSVSQSLSTLKSRR